MADSQTNFALGTATGYKQMPVRVIQSLKHKSGHNVTLSMPKMPGMTERYRERPSFQMGNQRGGPAANPNSHFDRIRGSLPNND